MALKRRIKVGDEFIYRDKNGVPQFKIVLLKIQGGESEIRIEMPDDFEPVERPALTESTSDAHT